ncbi:two-component response regulator ORR24-like [Salvia splendens]|uniref:two-component response regulator ORR24-like n=1 Tax=Salvia splendens TaxID=180675 RepID=UPI001C272828|nr:two-component response regulator ORR24-like [Salvia splendens]
MTVIDENFPAGMRVLAVDDDPTCLKLLDTLLKKCGYNVTTASQARVAWEMISENNDRFDLVISDVYMPDMDGFKLLELVGLKLDIPVIMLSADGDPELVLKGVNNGACDYLVKPIRIEELSNIWQHVVRRMKCNPKNLNDQTRAHQAIGEGHGSSSAGNTDQNEKCNRMKKDDEDVYDGDGNDDEDEDNVPRKKRRVTWTKELHMKFLQTISVLGIERAVPKKILNLMNVEGITRENVASHLQKYRHYLKKINNPATEQVVMNMGSLDGFGDFQSFSGARPTNVALSHCAGGMLGRVNSPGNVNIHNFTPSTLVQPSQAQNVSNSIDSVVATQQGQWSSAVTAVSSLVSGPMNNPQMLHGNAQQPLSSGGFIHQSASFNSGVSYPTGVNWQKRVEASEMQHPNPLLSAEPFHSQLPLNVFSDNNSSGTYVQNNPIALSSGLGLPPFEVSREMQCQVGSMGDVQNVAQCWAEQGQGSGVLNQKMDMYTGGGSSVGASALVQQNGNLATESTSSSNEDLLFSEQPKLLPGYTPQGYDPLDELVNVMLKPQQDEAVPDDELAFANHSFGAGTQ